MAKTNTIEVDSEITRCEQALQQALSDQAAVLRQIEERVEIARGVWAPRLTEAESSARRSAASWRVRQAREALDRAKLPHVSPVEARADLAKARVEFDEAKASLAQISADAQSGDPARELAALDADRDGAARAVQRAAKRLAVATATEQSAEDRERTKRAPLFEIRAKAIAKKLDEALGAVEEIVDDAISLAEQAQAARCPFEPVHIVTPPRIAEWREQQRKAGRL